MKQVEKTKQYDVIKFIGMILVVAAHCARMYSGGVVTPLNPSESLKFLVEFIYDYHMRLYMMAAGMVYGFCVIDRDKYRQSLIFLKNKGLRLILGRGAGGAGHGRLWVYKPDLRAVPGGWDLTYQQLQTFVVFGGLV